MVRQNAFPEWIIGNIPKMNGWLDAQVAPWVHLSHVRRRLQEAKDLVWQNFAPRQAPR